MGAQGDGGQQSLAILDDYASIAAKQFQNIPDLGKVSSYPDTINTVSSLQAQVDRLQPYTIISSMRERTAFPRELLSKLPNLKLLLTTGMRNASIDLDAASDHNVIVAGTTGKKSSVSSSTPADQGELDTDEPPPASFPSTNQQAWALLLSLCSRIPTDHAAVVNPSTPSAWQSGLAIPLGGKQLGLIGFGKLGAQMARTAVLGFGMRTPVLAWSENLTQQAADERAAAEGLPAGSVKACTGIEGKEELLRTSDVVSVHYVLSERSRGVIGARELEWMKRSAILINTSRGPLIDEGALLEVLRQGTIRGVALDVFWEEPLGENSPWRRADKFKSEVVLSPHMGYTNSGTMDVWYREQAEIVKKFVGGEEIINRMN